MANVKVFNQQGEETGTLELLDSIFDVEVNEHAVHRSVVRYLANQRQGTKSVKTRAEVRGGGRKPHPQKGTGRARQGSIRSPQFIGGGVVFAPKPKDYRIKLNKKERRLALHSVLTNKLENDEMLVLEDLQFDTLKTKNMVEFLEVFDINKAFVVTADINGNVIKASRNLQNVKVSTVDSINVYDLLNCDTFVVTKEAVEKIQEVYPSWQS